MSSSKQHDATGRLWIEEGVEREGTMAEVAPDLHLNRTFSFAVPESMETSVKLGQRVMVPIGRRGRLVKGFVIALDRRAWDTTVRPIHSVIDDDTYLTPELIELAREIAVHYACPLARTLRAITPEAVRKQRGLKTVRYVKLVRSFDEMAATGRRLGPKRKAVVERLSAAAGGVIDVASLLAEVGASPSVLRSLARDGCVEISTRKEIETVEPAAGPGDEPAFELNEEQRAALAAISEAIDAGAFRVNLLYGVSGSGKTEVYIHAIRRVIALGRQAILLVPEIVLTTQLVNRLACRFPNVAVNHSGMTEAERSVAWRRIAAGEIQVVVGTRSAVFAPCPNLGLICVDEEQETSYKNLRAPRFHVRDVAIMRANRLGIPVVLGSATPSVETWYHAEHRPDYRLLMIRSRVNALPLPKVHLVDMRDEFAERKQAVVISRLMERLLTETLDRGEQAVILMNRRGFAQRLYCPACKSGVVCPNCNVSLVVHTASGRAMCHYCRTRMETPTHCPNVACGAELVHAGVGTQRVEEALTALFPKAKLRRVDSDTMRHRDQVESVVRDFEDRKVDILVGTQMIAKGLDFPMVSFVGVAHADAGSLAGDFRAQERLFQLMTQVAGRAGRAEAPGRVVVQTTTPDLPGLKFALTHDYESFVAEELAVRRRVGLPPFRRLARVVLTHQREETARHEADALAARIRDAVASLPLEHADVLGPNPCLLSRLRGRYRYDLLIRTPNASSLRQLLRHLDEAKALRTKAESTVVDVDPVSLA